jgi:hypothetical protein
MVDAQKKKLRIYVADVTVQVMAPLAAIGLWFAIRRGDLVAPGLFALGWGIYVVEEYLVHRFIFHAPAPRRQFLFDALYRLHYGHHDQIANRQLLFTPLWFALALTSLNFAVVSILLPVKDTVIGVCGGGVCAYLLFEWMHLTAHFNASSKGRLGRYVTRRHSKHHFVDYGYWYTVSQGGQLVDRVCGSDPPRRKAVPNVRTCGLPEDDPRFLRSRVRFGLDKSLANNPGSIRVEAEKSLA